MPAWRRLKEAATKRVNANIVVVTLIEQVVNSRVSPEQPLTGFNIDVEAKICNNITRDLRRIGVVRVQVT